MAGIASNLKDGTLDEEGLTAALLAWFARAGRDLPWRRTRELYPVLVSEVMLQQTQVSRVVVRWPVWMARWPTANALAAAPLADVILCWSGLGYHRRAVNLHGAATRIATDGEPRSYAELLLLPGVGPYTAAAVAALALGEDRVPVDVNVRRVLSRALGVDTITPPPGRAAELTEALFDLGATVCIARRPRCAACPLAPDCPTRGATFSPARRQVPFAGSHRQRRGELLRQVGAGAIEIDAAEPEIVKSLVRDGLVVVRGGRITLPGR